MTRAPAAVAAYKQRIADGFIETVLRESVIVQPDGNRVAAVLSAEVTDVAIMTIAMIVAGSEACSSPTKTRAFCDQVASSLRKRIAEAQRAGSPFETITLGESQ